MEVKLVVSTPPGRAVGVEKQLRTFLLTGHKPARTGYREDSFYWELDVTVKQYVALMRRVVLFEKLTGVVADNRLFKAAAARMGATPDQLAEVRRLLVDGTSLTVVKQATAAEMDESGRSYWERFTARFRKR